MECTHGGKEYGQEGCKKTSHRSKKKREVLFGQVKERGALKWEGPVRGTKQENSGSHKATLK